MEKCNYLSLINEEIEIKREYLNKVLLIEPLCSQTVTELNSELDELIVEYYRLNLKVKQS